AEPGPRVPSYDGAVGADDEDFFSIGAGVGSASATEIPIRGFTGRESESCCIVDLPSDEDEAGPFGNGQHIAPAQLNVILRVRPTFDVGGDVYDHAAGRRMVLQLR